MIVLVRRQDGTVAEEWRCETFSEAYMVYNGRLKEYRREYSGHFDSVFKIELLQDGVIIQSDRSQDTLSWMFRG